jgi:RNA-directed DNA polymerase
VSEKRQKTQQLELSFTESQSDEVRKATGQGTESPLASRTPEDPTHTAKLMEQICGFENLTQAYKHVLSNKGGPGVDDITVDELGDYLRAHWAGIKQSLLDGSYKPQPVKRVNIPKPGGGLRSLGIPCAVDRFIQQAVLQILQPQWDPTFSEHSYGFRPKRSAHQAVAEAQKYVTEGYEIVVDIDLEKFFDRVNHDILMSRVARRVDDRRVLKLIRGYLTAGVMEGGLTSPLTEGTPQGGPLSPLLSNLLLDEFDRELESRGLRFVRYADDCNVYVRSTRAGERVKAGLTRFLAKRLRLTVNEAKSAVARVEDRQFLGFRIARTRKGWRRFIAARSVTRFKAKVRELTRRNRGISLARMILELSRYLTGWRVYYGHCEIPGQLIELDKWVRRRIRSVVWTQWKTTKQRRKQLLKLGVGLKLARAAAASSKGPWRLSGSTALQMALSNAHLQSLGLVSLIV